MEQQEQLLLIEYADDAIKDLILYHQSDDKRYRKLKSNAVFLKNLDEVMEIMRVVRNTAELRYFRRLNYEALKYEKEGSYSGRIGYNSKYRMIFNEFDEGIRIMLIEINEHYGDK